MTEFYNRRGINAIYYYSDKELLHLHREDGSAIEYTDGAKAWYLYGKNYSEQEYQVLTKRKNLIIFL